MKTTHIIATLLTIFLLSGVTTLSGETITLLNKGDQNVKKESRNVGSFTGISVGGAFNVFVKQTGSCGVEVEAMEEILPFITTNVEGNTLKIGMKKPPAKFWNNVETLNVYITVDQLTNLNLSGAVEIKSDGAIRGTELELEISGAVEADLNLAYSQLNGELSGATDLEMKGSADKVDLKISGAAELDAFGLAVKEMSLYASGAAEANVSVSGTLKISASGACDVKYKGNPGVNVHTSGASQRA